VAISAELGERRLVDVPAGTIEYRERGAGPALVFVHGVGVNADLWRRVVADLHRDHRCIAPDLPWGSHRHPLDPDADLSLPGMAHIVADVLAALDVGEVTVVANDTGGAVAQDLVGRHPERIGRLALTSCDAFDVFPPAPQRYLEFAARSPALMWLVAASVQLKPVQRLPTAYGWTTATPMPADVMRSFTRPVYESARVRRDMRRMLRAVDTRHTHAAARRLAGFDKPALVLWAEHDKLFPREHGRRLAELLPQCAFELVPGSRTFVPEERPDWLATRLRRFVRETGSAR
jgi:pimeloyl-ACP methyl ester carboxylesterase